MLVEKYYEFLRLFSSLFASYVKDGISLRDEENA